MTYGPDAVTSKQETAHTEKVSRAFYYKVLPHTTF